MLYILCAAILATVVAAAPGAVCSKAPYKNLLPLSKNAHVQVFCSSRYPLPSVTTIASTVTQTRTATAFSTDTFAATEVPTVLVFSTESSLSTATIDATSIETRTSIITSTITATVTVASSLTTTTTITRDAGCQKRDAEPTPLASIEERAVVPTAPTGHGFVNNPRARLAYAVYTAFVKSAVASQASIVCSCIATAQTLSAVATVTITSTSTAVISTTLIVTSPTTTTLAQTATLIATTTRPASTIEITSTTTIIETLLATATATVGFNACGQTFAAPVSNTPVAIKCGQNVIAGKTLISSTRVLDFYECLVAADTNGLATAFTFNDCQRSCNLYLGKLGDDALTTSDRDFVYGYFYP